MVADDTRPGTASDVSADSSGVTPACAALCAARQEWHDACAARAGAPASSETYATCVATFTDAALCARALGTPWPAESCDRIACEAFCAARLDNRRRCGARSFVTEATLAECLVIQTHGERCPGPPSYGGWATSACPGGVDAGP